MGTMSKEFELIRKIDAILVAMSWSKFKNLENAVCSACGKRNRACVGDDSGHVLCRDCFPVQPTYLPAASKHVPQGDDLLKLPRERFTKKFK